MKRTSVGKSHTGKVRKNNEDNYAIDDSSGFTVVADGMGGHAAGEVASKISVDAAASVLTASSPSFSKIFRSFQKNDSAVCAKRQVVEAIKLGNSQIRTKIESDPSLKGMGTTICIVKSFNKNRNVQLGFAGDSRIYRLRGGSLVQLSVDDSVIGEQLKNNLISAEEAERSPFRHMLTKALGVEDEIQPGTEEYSVLEKDIFLSCTDGLTDMVRDSEIEEVLAGTVDIQEAVDVLVDLALQKGGGDNVSLVLTQFGS